MEEGGFKIITYIMFIFGFAVWMIYGAPKLAEVSAKPNNTQITSTATTYQPQVHYQTIILR